MWPFKKPDSPTRGKPLEMGDISQFSYQGGTPEPDADLSEIERLFWDKDGPIVHKWHHYLPIYDRYFGPRRGSAVKMLEIGVALGGSLDFWRAYLGPEATLFGIDINPDCAQYNGRSGQVRIGSQDDPAFLDSVIEEMGGVDIVLDDGSHDSNHIRASFQAVFPRVTEGGIYLIEDLHAAYWTGFSGGYDAPSSFMNDVKAMIDDMHHWYHDRGQRIEAARGSVSGLHIHDSIVVIEKNQMARPVHSQQGTAG